MLLFIQSCEKDTVVPDPPAVPPRPLQIWLYRVNDPAKAQQFQYSYSGFELDVHYDFSAGTFIVKHEFSDTSTLTLTQWLNFLDKPERLGYWLDFKNLGPENETAAKQELVRIRNAFHLTQNIIVLESTSPNSLPLFDTLNFRISYYIPTFDPGNITVTEEVAYRDFIYEAITPNNIKTISADYVQLGFMEKWFPDQNKLLWYVDSFDPVVKETVINKTRADVSVQVLLVEENYKSTLFSNFAKRCSNEMKLNNKF
jgi:hypothetical protein